MDSNGADYTSDAGEVQTNVDGDSGDLTDSVDNTDKGRGGLEKIIEADNEHSASDQENYNTDSKKYEDVIKEFDKITQGKAEKIPIGSYEENGTNFTLYAYVIRGSNTTYNDEKIGCVLTSGAHGDEVEAVDGLKYTLRIIINNQELIDMLDPLIVIPILCPGAYIRGTRKNGYGIDINREFWSNGSNKPPEVILVENFIVDYYMHGKRWLFADFHMDDRYGYNYAYVLVNGHPYTSKLGESAMRKLRRLGYQHPKNNVDNLERLGNGVYEKDYSIYRGAFGPPSIANASQTYDIVLEINNTYGHSTALLEILHNLNNYASRKSSNYKYIHLELPRAA